MKIGVFDSGIGGLSVARAIEKAMPDAEVLFVHDSEHFPYATKSPEAIYGFVLPILQKLVEQHCDVIVVACNTVSTTLIDKLRQQCVVPLIGMEPMVKPAAEQTQSGIIAVCATPTTLASARYQWLKDTYAKKVRVLEPNCADWSELIEHNQMNEERLRQEIEPATEQGADVIVLGCTHYHWIEEDVKRIANGRAAVLQSESAIIKQLKRVLQRI